MTAAPPNPEEAPTGAGDAAGGVGDAGGVGGAGSTAPDRYVMSDADVDAAFAAASERALRDIAEVPAAEVVTTLAVHLMSAAAVKLGLGEGPDAAAETDLAEARTLITALAGLVVASAPDIGNMHAAPLRDGLTALQRAFREMSAIPDAAGEGPGEKWTGPVY